MGLIEHDIRILIAEDDEDDLLLFKELIIEGAHGVKVTVDSAPDREDIVRKLSESDYDLFFLDYRLGEWNGLDILKDIREKGYTLPVIMLTGQGDQEDCCSSHESRRHRLSG